MTEWEFVGEVKEWIALALDRNTDLPFSTAKLEQRGRGSNKRRDLTLLDKKGVAVVTGEVKLPFAIDGTSPFRTDVVIDARKKAELAGAQFFFTWNVNQCVLWRTATAGAGVQDREYEQWVVTHVTNAEQLKGTSAESEIRDWLVKFLYALARALRGDETFGVRSPDAKFVDALEAALAFPIEATFRALQDKYKNAAVKRDLDRWMLSLGWQIVDDAEGKRALLKNAAKFACYLLVNKLVFHEALLKKYKGRFEPLKAPPEVTTGDDLQQRLHLAFEDAKRITGDYETVFGDDPIAVANSIPFYADESVPGWRALIQQIHDFDFSKLDYEVVGNIFERLISPEERHKYGQFYTRVEVVDLINSFCIREPDARVMDPACGGGTFLVRAYARKRALGGRAHKDLLTDIYGVDISKFAAHLTTMNLATRDLVEDENYPRIGREDFFNVMPQQTFVQLPQKLVSKGLGKNTLQPVAIPALDAVVGNPPYVRQEDIPKAKSGKKAPEAGSKEFYQSLTKKLAGADLSGRSDLHCYFWPHASTFLKEDGMLGLITSSQWLDVEYGFRLQSWLLRNFEILAVLESPVEPWFVGARVATTVTIARKCIDETRRRENLVRFVQLRAPLAQLLQHDGTTIGAIRSADMLRDEILALTQNVSEPRFRARVVRQGDLWQSGVALGKLMRLIDDEEEGESPHPTSNDYFGGKWGVYLRAPDLWFELLDRYGEKFVPLGQLAEIRRGITSGKDSFFFPKDTSAECLAKIADSIAFEHEYGVPRKDVESGRVKLVLAGDKRGELHAIEAEYLEPEVHSLMDVHRYVIGSEECTKLVTLFPSDSALKRYAAKYVKWGERESFHTSATNAAREGEGRRWYDLTSYKRASVILPKIQQYRFVAPVNPELRYQSSSLLGLYDLPEAKTDTFAGLLNCTIVVFARMLYARGLGNEGNTQLDVYSAKMMPVPDVLTAARSAEKIAKAFRALTTRSALSFVSERRMREMSYGKSGRENELAALSDQSELDMPDRRDLDDAVLELIGIKSKRERDEWLNRLYAYLRSFFEETRQKEEKAIVNKNTSQRKGAVSPQDLATEIIQHFADHAPRFLRNYNDYVAEWMAGDDAWIALEIVPQTEPTVSEDMLQLGVEFKRGKKIVKFVAAPTRTHAELLALAGETGIMSFVKLPRTEQKAASLLRDAKAYFGERTAKIESIVDERVSDSSLREKVLAHVNERLRAQLIRSGNQLKERAIG